MKLTLSVGLLLAEKCASLAELGRVATYNTLIIVLTIVIQFASNSFLYLKTIVEKLSGNGGRQHVFDILVKRPLCLFFNAVNLARVVTDGVMRDHAIYLLVPWLYDGRAARLGHDLLET